MATTRSLSSSKGSKKSLPFYEAPKKQTSAQIIAEARKSVRSLPTDRPYTPATSGRILFGNQDGLSRPPSVFSIGAHHFGDERLSRPPSGQKLVPIEKQLGAASDIKLSSKIKPTPPTPVQSCHDLSMTGDLSTKNETASSKLDSRKAEAVAFWDAQVAPLLSELETTSSDDVAHLCQVCEALWTNLVQQSLLGKTGGAAGSKRRAAILRTVFRLLDHKEPRLLLKVARIIIAMKVTGKNLLNVCKLLFALGKNEANDGIFLDEQISDPLTDLLSTADPLTDTEAMVYGLGTVKLLASNSDLREQLASAGVMTLLASTLQKCTKQGSTESASKPHVANVLVQLTAALRNLSESPSLHSEFLSTSSILSRLASVLSDHLDNSDIVFNISRLLSKLTLHAECQAAVIQCPSFLPLFLQTLTTHASSALSQGWSELLKEPSSSPHHTLGFLSSHKDIIVRVCFILGNLTTDDNSTREQLFFSHCALPILNNISSKYFSAEQEQPKVKTAKSSKKAVSRPEDVLVKLVRLVANLSVHPRVGPAIACDEATVRQILNILSCMPLPLYEELVLNALATLNNLSYYDEPDSCVVQKQQEITELLVSVVLEESSEGLLECTRVYGNLSRYPTVRRILAEKKVDEMMVTLLDSGRREMVYCSCGVLINLMADAHHRVILNSNGGVQKLVDVLRDFGHNDWQLASLVCKTLWNYSEQLASTASCFREEESKQLIQLLESYSSKDFIVRIVPEETKHTSWKNDFLPVAQNLLARIRSYHTSLVPLS